MDTVVASRQDQEQLSKNEDPVAFLPAFSMEVGGSLEPTESFRGAYERFRWDPLSAYDETLVVDELLNRSKRTLKSLDIPLQETTSLALFQNLERLSLRLVFHVPQDAIRNLPYLRYRQLVLSPKVTIVRLSTTDRPQTPPSFQSSRRFAPSIPRSSFPRS